MMKFDIHKRPVTSICCMCCKWINEWYNINVFVTGHCLTMCKWLRMQIYHAATDALFLSANQEYVGLFLSAFILDTSLWRNMGVMASQISSDSHYFFISCSSQQQRNHQSSSILDVRERKPLRSHHYGISIVKTIVIVAYLLYQSTQNNS